ncbi:MAG: DUF63 family protein [Candidatus Nanohaloarchaea archaeon]
MPSIKRVLSPVIERLIGFSQFSFLSTLILAIAAVAYLAWLKDILDRKDIEMTGYLLAGSVPWALAAGELFSLSANGITGISRILSVIISIIVIPLILIILHNLSLRKDVLNHEKMFGYSGAALFLIISSFFISFDIYSFLTILAFGGFVFATISAMMKYVPSSMFLFSAITGQLLDAASTYIALVYFNLNETQVLGRGLISVFGPSGIFLLKLPIILAIFYLAKEYEIEGGRMYLGMIALIGLSISANNISNLLV